MVRKTPCSLNSRRAVSFCCSLRAVVEHPLAAEDVAAAARHRAVEAAVVEQGGEHGVVAPGAQEHPVPVFPRLADGCQRAVGRDVAAGRGQGTVDVEKDQLRLHIVPSLSKSQISQTKAPGQSRTPFLSTGSPVSRFVKLPGVLTGTTRSESAKLNSAASFSPLL